jgi:hypothetical protein
MRSGTQYHHHHQVLYNIDIEFGVPIKLVRLKNMCLNKTYSNIHIGNNFAGFEFLMAVVM